MVVANEIEESTFRRTRLQSNLEISSSISFTLYILAIAASLVHKDFDCDPEK